MTVGETRKRVCIFGAGAVGGYLAANLIRYTAAEVSLVGRGPHLAAIQGKGLCLRRKDGEAFVCRPANATEDPRELSDQDFVMVTIKAHSLSASAEQIAELLGPTGTAVFLNNGLPWWWHFRGDVTQAQTLPMIDPGGRLWSKIGPERVLGGVVYSANEVTEPGIIGHKGFNRWIIGEPDGSTSGRLNAIASLMSEAGLNAEASMNIRRDIWEKLLLNLTVSPFATLTRLDSSGLENDHDLQILRKRLFEECVAIPLAAGIEIDRPFEELPALIPRSRPSMLQDIDAGRSTEVEAIFGQTQAFARQLGVRTPILDILLPILRGLDRAASSLDTARVTKT